MDMPAPRRHIRCLCANPAKSGPSGPRSRVRKTRILAHDETISPIAAAKRQKNTAHGASRGSWQETSQPRRGERSLPHAGQGGPPKPGFGLSGQSRAEQSLPAALPSFFVPSIPTQFPPLLTARCTVDEPQHPHSKFRQEREI